MYKNNILRGSMYTHSLKKTFNKIFIKLLLCNSLYTTTKSKENLTYFILHSTDELFYMNVKSCKEYHSDTLNHYYLFF